MSKRKPAPTSEEAVQAVKAELAALAAQPSTPLVELPEDRSNLDQDAWSRAYQAHRASVEAREAEAVAPLAKRWPFLVWSCSLAEDKTTVSYVRAHLPETSLYRVPSTGRLTLVEVTLSTAWGVRADSYRGRVRACEVQVDTTDVGVCAGSSKRHPFDSLAEGLAWVESQVGQVTWPSFGTLDDDQD